MPKATYVQASFLGGEYSQEAQGRIDLPTYRQAMRVCFNTIVMESGATQRRPGTRHGAVMRGGGAGVVISFDFNQSAPYEMLYTDGFLRLLNEVRLATTNDDVVITSISAANPAVVTIAAARTWATADQTRFTTNVTQLLRRDIAITVLSPTTFSIADAVTGAAIDGATLDAFTSGTVARIAEIVTPYTGGSWANLRSVQAETTAVLLNGTAPQVLSVTQQPTATAFAEFSLDPADFLDGPYLDPIPGSWATSNNLSGIVTVTFSFQPWSAGTAYNKGDYVTVAGQGYKSKLANNQNHVPPNGTWWALVNAGDPINGGAGFTTADIGRLIRLFSEPPLWDATILYSAPAIVAYAASGNAIGYYQATAAIGAGVKPGTTTSWSVVSGATIAIWTWGRILGIATAGITAPDSFIADMSNSAGAFDGNPVKPFASSSTFSVPTVTYPGWAQFAWPLGSLVQFGNVGYRLDATVVAGVPVNYFFPPPAQPGYWTNIGALSNLAFANYVGGHLPAPTQLSSVTITPTNDIGFTNSPQNAVTLNWRGKTGGTPPANSADGVLLATTGSIANTFSPVTLTTGDSTAYTWSWIEEGSAYNQPLPDDGSHSFLAKMGIAQIQFFSPNITNGAAITVQIAGDPLLYANACRKWRLGAYGGANGYPTCGTYIDGRIWLSGVIGNRADSSKSNVFRNGQLVLNFAPTLPDGTVADDNAISAIFTGPDVNGIFWMEPDQQGIICGTQAGEWLIYAPAQGVMAPANVDARRVTKIGCANILPRRTDHTVVFVQKFLRELQEYFADVYSGKFSSPQLNKNAKHMAVSGVLEIAYQQQKASIIWARTGAGGLFGVTYQRDSLTTSRGPDIAGAHRHTLGSGRAVRSLSVGGSSGGNLDSPYLVTEDAGGGNFHAEVLTDLLDEGFALSDAWQLDGALQPTSFVIDPTPAAGAPYGGVRLYGLWPLNGKTVAAYLCGLDCGSRGVGDDGLPVFLDFAVANGTCFVPFGDSVSQGCGDGLFTQALVTPFLGAASLPMVVGFPYTSDGQIVRPALQQETGSPSGPRLGELARSHKWSALLYGCVNGTISFGTDFDHLMPAIFTKGDLETRFTKLEPFSGIHHDLLDDDSGYDNAICWRITRPNPAWVIALGGFIQTQGE